jgi:hypothetical protein
MTMTIAETITLSESASADSTGIPKSGTGTSALTIPDTEASALTIPDTEASSTTTPEPVAGAGKTSALIPRSRAPLNSPSLRYAEEIVRLHERLRWRGLPEAIIGTPLFHHQDNGDGLTTIVVSENQLPDRYLRGIMGFRLAQFLRLGWMDAEIAYQRALFHEPLGEPQPVPTLHTVTLTGAGRIVGYLALVGSADESGLPLDSPNRKLFPAETAHRVELLSGFAGPGLTTHQVFEIKRFVRDLAMPHGPQRDRVPWHLILALGKAASSQPGEIEVVVGDSTEDGALRHLRLLGFDSRVIEGTAPSLPRTELMWPSYEKPKLAKPFAARAPAKFDLKLGIVASALSLPPEPGWQREALRRISRAETTK